nr:MAG TPA: hypothetical protein [Bacteriophage sp.]
MNMLRMAVSLKTFMVNNSNLFHMIILIWKMKITRKLL